MKEIVAAAKARGVELEDQVIQEMIGVDPLEIYLSPSMLADVRKVGHFLSPYLLSSCGSIAVLIIGVGELYRV